MRFSRLAAAAATGLLVLYALSAPAAPTDAALQDLRSPVAVVRANAAAALGRAGDRAAVPALLAAWAMSESRNGVIVARGGAACGFSLYVKDGMPKFGLKRGDDSAVAIAAGTQDVVGRWVHLTAVVKPDTIELYVDGKLGATAKTAGCMTGDPGQGMEIGFDAGNSAAEITDAFEGIIDEVRVFDVALTPDQIAKLPADRGAGPLGPQ